jgi:hypothetical protein
MTSSFGRRSNPAILPRPDGRQQTGGSHRPLRQTLATQRRRSANEAPPHRRHSSLPLRVARMVKALVGEAVSVLPLTTAGCGLAWSTSKEPAGATPCYASLAKRWSVQSTARRPKPAPDRQFNLLPPPRQNEVRRPAFRATRGSPQIEPEIVANSEQDFRQLPGHRIKRQPQVARAECRAWPWFVTGGSRGRVFVGAPYRRQRVRAPDGTEPR